MTELKVFEKVLLVLTLCGIVRGFEEFLEEVVLKPMNNGHVSADFNFIIRATPEKCKNHFDLVPKVVGEFLHDHHLEELDLSLARGVWRTKTWGYPSFPAPAGAKVVARFSQKVEDVDDQWKRLTNALSGQFCASLNFLDSAQTSWPEWSLQPIGVTQQGHNTSYFRYGTLPGENVCTENLTPWKKLLPCTGKRGFSTLLNARRIHATLYHSIGLSLRKVCPDGNFKECEVPLVEMRQHVSLVFDPVTFPENRNKHRDLVRLNSNNWSVRSLFGMSLTSKCPLASKSKLYVVKPHLDRGHEALFRLEPEEEGEKIVVDGQTVIAFDMDSLIEKDTNNIYAHYNEKFVTSNALVRTLNPAEPSLSVNRYQTGYGQEKGGIVTQIQNTSNKKITVVFLDVIPWFLRIYFHTLKVYSVKDGEKKLISPLMTKFTPGLDRTKPYTLEAVIELSPQSTTQVSIEFEHSILKWNEYPPDANKGFYIGSALVSAILPSNQSYGSSTILNTRYSTFEETFLHAEPRDCLIELFSESLLINLPTPDFSMPYNVICLACTVVAFAFGPMVNYTTKSLKIIDSNAEAPSGPKEKLKKLLNKLPVVKSFLKSSGTKTVESQEVENESENKKDS